MTPTFDLSLGKVSQALGRRAGPRLQQFLHTKSQEMFSQDMHGQIVTSPGFDLDCRQIFHIFCKAYDHQGAKGEAVKVINGIFNMLDFLPLLFVPSGGKS